MSNESTPQLIVTDDGTIVTYEESCGNVFEDLGLPNARELLAKSRLCIAILRAMQSKAWTARQTAQCLGVERERIMEMRAGRLRTFTVAELKSWLAKLEKTS